MPDDATGPAPDPTPTAPTTAAAAKPREPKWGDDPETIPQARRDELLALHAAQVKWLAETAPDRSFRQSPFAVATRPKGVLRRPDDTPPLTGAEVHFLSRSFPRNLHLEGADLSAARIEGVDLRYVHLEGADLSAAYLEGVYLFGGRLEGARLDSAYLEGANLTAAHLENTDLTEAHLEHAFLRKAYMDGATLIGVHLENTELRFVHLVGADLLGVHLEGATLSFAHLEGTDLRGASFSGATGLDSTVVFDAQVGMPRMADVRWQDVNLAVVSWPERPMLGDERAARELEKAPLTKDRYSDEPLPKDASREDRRRAEAERNSAILDAWRGAARAYRQLASVMRDQGMSDEADRFAYRGQVCQRQLYRVQGKRVRRAFSRFLDLLAGYGFKPERTLAAYLLVIAGFAVAYALVTHGVFSLGLGPSAIHPLPWYEALVLSVSSFHGRGFFQPVQSLGDPVAILAAGEAVIGLLIEISFIATFTQRFFGK